MDALGGAEVVESVDGRAHWQGACADDELVVLDRFGRTIGVADVHPLAGDVDVGGVGVHTELHAGGFEVRVRAVGEVAPVGDLAGDVIRNPADRKVRVGVGDDDCDLDRRVEFPRTERSGDAGVTATDRDESHIPILTGGDTSVKLESMNIESDLSLARRAGIYAALGDPARLRIVDILTTGDAAPTELAEALGMPSNLLAHHLKVLREVGLVSSHRSQGDGRRQYLRLIEHSASLAPHVAPSPTRVVFVCTANSARSQLAAALWRQASEVPSASAGTHPADRIDPGAIEAAGRHDLPLPRLRPRALADVIAEGDLVITVCDLAHEELDVPHDLHWSIPDPVRVGTTKAFDAAYAEIQGRVRALAPRLAS